MVWFLGGKKDIGTSIKALQGTSSSTLSNILEKLEAFEYDKDQAQDKEDISK